MRNLFLKKLTVLSAAACFTTAMWAQKQDVPRGWHLLDLQKDGFYGISLDKAYDFLKAKKIKSKPVVVAVIDSGIDTTHEDLKSVLWTNPGEIPGNGIDDDKNGYVDDIHGWNFLGGRDGRNVKEDSYEAARVYHMYKDKFENITDTSTLDSHDRALYDMWKKADNDLGEMDPKEKLNLMLIKKAYEDALAGDSVLKKEMNKTAYTGKDVQDFTPQDLDGKRAKEKVMRLYLGLQVDMDQDSKGLYDDIAEFISGEERKAEAKKKEPENYRGEIVQDNYNDINDRFYGNNDVMANTPFHGTHVSGIIAADRTNDLGMKGIADNVKIMLIRAVPDGDEHDKDVALAIRYAADNGAKVINMSFGKGFSPQKQWVDDAVKYAEEKGVLLVHAAGNDHADNDTTDNFPNPIFRDNGKKATNWITVGASGDPKTGGLVADFSNYGKKEVDVFAPGVKIYSTIPGGNTYGNAQGTSMASPVVAGLAALILEYFPNLTAEQVKYVIEKSSVKPDIKVTDPGNQQTVNLDDICKTGGIINAYDAVKLASTLKGEREPKKTKPVKTKSSVKRKVG
ncbi:MAG TPA: S8 family peptidase [Chitinophagaceae bacterium]|nr:S8 family peptidase [Chitinophagaceae bacterium]